MTEQKLTELMQHISPRYTEEAAARAAKAKPRFSLMGAAGVLAGAAMCAAVIGGVIYASRQNLPVETASSAVTDTVSEQTTAVPASTETTAAAVSEAAKKAVTQLAETEITEVPAESVSISAAVSTAQITVTAPAQTTAAPVRIKQTSAAAETAASTSLLPYRHTEAKSESTAAQTTAAATEAAPAEVVYQLGDVDMDGYVTYADVALLYLNSSVKKYAEDNHVPIPDYPQKLTNEQLALATFVHSSPNEVGAEDSLEFMYSIRELYPNRVEGDYPYTNEEAEKLNNEWIESLKSGKLYTEVSIMDTKPVAEGNLNAFQVYMMYRIGLYRNSLFGKPTIYTETVSEGSLDDGTIQNKTITTDELYMTSEQFDAYLSYMREACIERAHELGR